MGMNVNGRIEMGEKEIELGGKRVLRVVVKQRGIIS